MSEPSETAAIVAAKRANNVDVQFFWYDNKLLMYPALPALLDTIRFTEKVSKCDKSTRWRRMMVYEKKNAYSVVTSHGEDIVVTFQGFFMRLYRTAILEGLTANVQDLRLTSSKDGLFPKPRLDLMYGFRFSQEALLTEMLSKGISGLLGAPTRWGKSTLIVNTLRAFPTITAVLTAPGVDLINQLYDDLMGERGIKGREIRLISGKTRKAPTKTGINVVSMDSLHKIDPSSVGLVLCDEPHAAPANSRIAMIDRFTNARRYGYGATLHGRADGRDLLIEGLFGPVLAERTYLEAVAEGAICPLHIIFLRKEITPMEYGDRDRAYDELLFMNNEIALTVAEICHSVIPAEQQTLIFIKHEKQAELFLDKIGRDTALAMAKKLTDKERQEMTDAVRRNDITRCLCTRIFVQGVTFPDVRVLINAEAGGNTTSAIQKPGRLAQIRPGKKCGIVIDLNFVPQDGFALSNYTGEGWTALCRDSKARRKAYSEKGYEIHDVKNLEELKHVFDSLQ